VAAMSDPLGGSQVDQAKTETLAPRIENELIKPKGCQTICPD